jgi:hypothetical protein
MSCNENDGRPGARTRSGVSGRRRGNVVVLRSDFGGQLHRTKTGGLGAARFCRRDSEGELGAELHHARPADGVEDAPEVIGVCEVVAGVGEVDVVEDVEDVPAELERRALGQARVLREAEVEALLAEAAQDVAAEVAEAALRRAQRASVLY